MFNLKKRNKLLSINNLERMIIDNGCVQTPLYTRGKQVSLIIKPRGTIFSKFRKNKPAKF